MTRTLCLLVVIQAACMMPPTATEQDLRMRAPGTYVTAGPDGEPIRLTLNPDGSGDINGERGSWDIRFGRIILSDGQDAVAADLVGDQLSVYLPDGQLVFTREQAGGTQEGAFAGAGVSAAGGAPHAGSGGGPARPFAPEATLAGEEVAPKDSGAEFKVPDGWAHGFERDEQGNESYALRPRGVEDAGIALTRRVLTAAEQQTPVSQLLQQGLQEMVGQVSLHVVVPAEDLEVRGQRAGRTIVRAQPGRGQPEIELYLAGVVVEHYGFVIGAVYPADQADEMRPAVDTILSSFRGSVPPENAELRAQVLGCWSHFTSSTGGTGSGSSETRLRFAGDGSFDYHHYTSISVEGLGSSRESRDAGRFRVEGNAITTMSSQGGSITSYEVGLQGGMLYLNGTRYLPCS
jgi:hypothetical protein